ncbi:MAG: LLM class flavin-dependent oxidoreductase [Dehalococcoidia bacterium]
MAMRANPLRFGVNLTNQPFAETLSICRAAEEHGFDTVALADRPPESSLEGWTLACAIAALTQRLIITHRTLNVPFRNPALLAKAAATLDVISGGRLELTLGAGAQESHFRAYGIPSASPGDRFRALREAVIILRGMWTQPKFTYQGRHYQVEEVELQPKPVRGSIPIWIGALGPQMMDYTGRTADGWMKNRGWPTSVDELRSLIEQLEAGAKSAGRDPATIRRVLNGAGGVREGRSPEPLHSRAGLVGTAEEVLEAIAVYREIGIDTFYLAFPPENTVEQIRLFAREVLPRARSSPE